MESSSVPTTSHTISRTKTDRKEQQKVCEYSTIQTGLKGICLDDKMYNLIQLCVSIVSTIACEASLLATFHVTRLLQDSKTKIPELDQTFFYQCLATIANMGGKRTSTIESLQKSMNLFKDLYPKGYKAKARLPCLSALLNQAAQQCQQNFAVSTEQSFYGRLCRWFRMKIDQHSMASKTDYYTKKIMKSLVSLLIQSSLRKVKVKDWMVRYKLFKNEYFPIPATELKWMEILCKQATDMICANEILPKGDEELLEALPLQIKENPHMYLRCLYIMLTDLEAYNATKEVKDTKKCKKVFTLLPQKGLKAMHLLFSNTAMRDFHHHLTKPERKAKKKAAREEAKKLKSEQPKVSKVSVSKSISKKPTAKRQNVSSMEIDLEEEDDDEDDDETEVITNSKKRKISSVKKQDENCEEIELFTIAEMNVLVPTKKARKTSVKKPKSLSSNKKGRRFQVPNLSEEEKQRIAEEKRVMDEEKQQAALASAIENRKLWDQYFNFRKVVGSEKGKIFACFLKTDGVSASLTMMCPKPAESVELNNDAKVQRAADMIAQAKVLLAFDPGYKPTLQGVIHDPKALATLSLPKGHSDRIKYQTITYTKKEYYHEAGINHRMNMTNLWMLKKEEIMTFNREVKTAKTANFDTLKSHISHLLLNLAPVMEFYGAKRFRRLNFHTNQCKKAAIQKLSVKMRGGRKSKIKPHETLLIWGDASIGYTMKGCQSVPTSSLRRAMGKIIPTVDQDEFRTSKLCCCCHQKMEGLFNEVTKKRSFHLRVCTNDECNRSIWDRNTNAAINILNKYLNFASGQKEWEAFSREKKCCTIENDSDLEDSE